MTGPRQLYFYWRVAMGDRDVALAAVQRWQHERMIDIIGLQATLFVRTDPAQDRATVMEVYAATSPLGIDEGTQARLVAEGGDCTALWRQGDRKFEAFDQVS